ncbi:MAG: hypothetical protein FWH22_06175 [Fibromonadales bacterium]|nr:hypothetical protein [Fibromonadales bacterium]
MQFPELLLLLGGLLLDDSATDELLELGGLLEDEGIIEELLDDMLLDDDAIPP